MAKSPNEPDVGTGVGDAILQVAEDARAYALAQVDVAKAIATARLRAAKVGIILGFAAVFLAGSALTALLVGLILALAAVTGPLLATAIVAVAVLGLAGLLGATAASRLSRALGGDA
ncbi:phage holin family protein [Sphingomonas sp. Leaf33]|uniref:phage holin family protein n=1 Tax=Sphingomonas sp. Leaf33 TaxID=1736215 RepID=UPI0006F31D32|nr:phage holin family protein [Sphingomonas sp. Leaf33]